MRRLAFALAIFCTLAVGACKTPPGGSRQPPQPAPSAVCSSFQSFFRENIDRSWGGGLNILGMGGNIGYHQIVQSIRLTEDESKRQMAVAASACEAFARGDIALTDYVRLMDAALRSGTEGQAAAGSDPAGFLAALDQRLETLRSREGVSERFAEVIERLDAIVEQRRAGLPQTLATASAAQQDPAAAAALYQAVQARGAGGDVAVLDPSEAAFRGEVISRLARLESATDRPGLPEAREVRGRRFIIFFAPGSAAIEPGFQALIREEMRALRRDDRPQPIAALVEGYADPTGSRASNEQLAGRRAAAVAEILSGLGATVTTRADGETSQFGQPLQMNRIVVISLSAG